MPRIFVNSVVNTPAITNGDCSYVEWSSRFEIDPEYETELVDLMNQSFLAGLHHLAEKLGRNQLCLLEISSAIAKVLLLRKLNLLNAHAF